MHCQKLNDLPTLPKIFSIVYELSLFDGIKWVIRVSTKPCAYIGKDHQNIENESCYESCFKLLDKVIRGEHFVKTCIT